jgi:hypothetical protein
VRKVRSKSPNIFEMPHLAAFLFNSPVMIPNAPGSGEMPLLPAHFDALDALFAFLTLFVIIKFVNSLRPILGE